MTTPKKSIEHSELTTVEASEADAVSTVSPEPPEPEPVDELPEVVVTRSRPRLVTKPVERRRDITPRERPERQPRPGGRRAKLDLEGALRERRAEQSDEDGEFADSQDDDVASPARVASAARPAVAPATLRPRHYGLILSLFLMVIVPLGASAWYLWTVAVDQYESRVGFSVRAEGAPATPDIFGGLLGAPSTSTAEDMHILNEFIISQEMVETVDAKLDLRRRFSLPQDDPLFAFDPGGTIEDLRAYWERMVVVDYDGATGLMALRIYAFTPQDAREIATAVLDESSDAINKLSERARDDSTRYAREAFDSAKARVAEARAAVTDFRAKNQISDPAADVASQMGVLSSLQQQLASALVELDLLRASAQTDDPRIGQHERRIAAIEDRIAQERDKLGVGEGGTGFAKILGDFEKLKVDLVFAEQTYLAALASFDRATATAQQQSRYLATYVEPTRAEASTAPRRPIWLLMIGLACFFIWASSVLVYYSLRDRR